MTPILDPRLRLQADARGRHRHPPRRGLQVVRRRAPPHARHRARAARRSGCSSARRRCRSSASQVATWIEHRYGERLRGDRREGDRRRAHPRRARLPRQDVRHAGARRPTRRSCSRDRDRVIASLLGASGGFVVGLTSVGSGTFFGLVMLLVFPLTAAKIVGTDIFHAAALLWVAGVSHLVARQRRPRRDGVAPARLDPRRAVREPADREAAGADRSASGSRPCSR